MLVTKKLVKLSKRKKTSKKGDSGKVLIVGGSRDYVGAVALAGLAALRSGVDWVTIVAPEKVAYSINSISPDLVTHKLKGEYFTESHIVETMFLSNKYNTILIGNGISLRSKDFSKKLIKSISKQKVIDADAIKAISQFDINNSIITPHIKELEIFLKNSKINPNKIINLHKNKKYQLAASLIQKSLSNFLRDNIILLKGPIDLIITKNKVYQNKTGNPGMTKAGTGDVLAGLTAGFLAQTNNKEQSAINAAYYNGKIGDILLKKHQGYTYLASDMIEEIKKIYK